MRNIRKDFSILKNKYERIGKGNVRLAQSTLILSKVMSPTANVYKFPVLENDPVDQTNDLYPETRLNINDEFIITDLGLYLSGRVEDDNDENLKFYQLFTTPPVELKSQFARTGGLYNGKFSISVNNITYLEGWDTQKHHYRGVTQFRSFSTGQLTTLPNIDYSTHGMFPVTPNITLSGAKKNDLTLTLEDPLTATTGTLNLPNTTVAAIIVEGITLVLRGFLAQNAAAFQ